jgi:hypothetical protein
MHAILHRKSASKKPNFIKGAASAPTPRDRGMAPPTSSRASARRRRHRPDRFALQRRDVRLETADLIGETALGQLAQPLGFRV